MPERGQVSATGVRLGTRGSALARWQTDFVAGLLAAAWPGLACAVEVIQSAGDRLLDTPLPLLGGKGVFTAELEAALRAGAIDLAVHSLKDLPTGQADGLAIGAIPARAAVADVLVSRRGYTLDNLPRGAAVGTSSRRRAAQLLVRRPDLRILDLRGNVDTRVRKALAADSPYDAVVLAQAGLARLGLESAASQVLALDDMLPAPGQGALAVQCRAEPPALALLAPLDDEPARRAVAAERAFLAGLGGGCALPIAAYAEVTGAGDGARLALRGRVTRPDGGHQLDLVANGPARDAVQIGGALAVQALAEGAAELLATGDAP
jgi:hydroxymethylbilane synthase